MTHLRSCTDTILTFAPISSNSSQRSWSLTRGSRPDKNLQKKVNVSMLRLCNGVSRHKCMRHNYETKLICTHNWLVCRTRLSTIVCRPYVFDGRPTKTRFIVVVCLAGTAGGIFVAFDLASFPLMMSSRDMSNRSIVICGDRVSYCSFYMEV